MDALDDRTRRITMNREMDVIAARSLAHALMKRHGLGDWHFCFDRAKRRFGSCSSHRRTITLSIPLTLLNSEAEVRDTLLHEIAHALAPGGHHAAWRRKCIEIGAKPKRCFSGKTVNLPPIRRRVQYVGRCACDIRHIKARRPTRKYLCRRCRTVLLWVAEIPRPTPV
ncbi:MAG: SprT-like domain-containing protein [Tepidisphaeraceae bacterium]